MQRSFKPLRIETRLLGIKAMKLSEMSEDNLKENRDYFAEQAVKANKHYVGVRERDEIVNMFTKWSKLYEETLQSRKQSIN